MKIEIRQIKSTETSYWGASFEFTQKKGGIDPADYATVYTCERDGINAELEVLWHEFNLNHPADYQAHSLMVSDVIVRYDGEKREAWYINNFGFEDVTNIFFKEES